MDIYNLNIKLPRTFNDSEVIRDFKVIAVSLSLDLMIPNRDIEIPYDYLHEGIYDYFSVNGIQRMELFGGKYASEDDILSEILDFVECTLGDRGTYDNLQTLFGLPGELCGAYVCMTDSEITYAIYN